MTRLEAIWFPCVLLQLAAVSSIGIRAHADDSESSLRRPVALAPSADGKWLYVANRDSGTISIVDLNSWQIAGEMNVGCRLADIAFVGDRPQGLAADEAAHEIILLDVNGPELKPRQRLSISPYPASILLSSDGQRAAVASLWSRRLTLLSCAEQTLTTGWMLDLPFAPRAQLWLPGEEQLLVADGFGGRLAIVDARTGKITEQRQIPAHNIRGLGLSPNGEMLLISHQMLNDLAHSIRNDIHWGLLMSNDLRWLRIDSFLRGGEHLYRGGHMHPLGDSGRGGGDPGALDVAADGTVVVTLSGVNEVAFGKEGDFSMQRLKVGRRPTAVKLSADGGTAYVANTFDDSISIVDLRKRAVAVTVPLGQAPELTLQQRGELLFYDSRLSHDGWMSCHSCHTDGHTNGQLNDNFSDRSFGAAKRVPSLFGVKDTLPLAWNGEVKSLERQIHNSINNTMQREDTLASEDVAALLAYLKSLEAPPPVDRLRGTEDRAAVSRGKAVFAREKCATCHPGPTYTSPQVYDVGLRDSQGLKEFNPPSLRGLSHRDSYFHDASATTLKSVFSDFHHPYGSLDSAEDIHDLIAFLRSL